MIEIRIIEETAAGALKTLQALSATAQANPELLTTPAPISLDPPKATKPAAQEPEPEEAPTVDAAELEEAVKDVPVTKEDARAVLNQLRSKKGPEAVRAILESFGVKGFTMLPEDSYAAVVKAAREAMA